MAWLFLGGLAAGASFLVGRAIYRRSHQDAAARAAGLEPADDLTHLPRSLQSTALWALADGGFEGRVLRGRFARTAGDVEVTAFDLATLRDRRGEWAYLPVEPPFRIAGVVSVVVCEVPRSFPHVLFKRTGVGDELLDDTHIDRLMHVAKNARDRLGVKRSFAAELPALPTKRADVALPEHWRAYTHAPDLLDDLLGKGLRETLEQANRRDLVIELLDGLVIVYPAAREVVGPDAFADLTTTTLQIVDGVLLASSNLTPRGIDVTVP